MWEESRVRVRLGWLEGAHGGCCSSECDLARGVWNKAGLVAALVLHKTYGFLGRAVESVAKYSVTVFPNIGPSCNRRFPESPPA